MAQRRRSTQRRRTAACEKLAAEVAREWVPKCTLKQIARGTAAFNRERRRDRRLERRAGAAADRRRHDAGSVRFGGRRLGGAAGLGGLRRLGQSLLLEDTDRSELFVAPLQQIVERDFGESLQIGDD